MNWKAIERSRQKYYRLAEKEYRAVIMSQVNKVADYIEANGQMSEDVLKMIITEPEVRQVYNYIYKRTGGDYAAQVYSQFVTGEVLRVEFEKAMENYVINNLGDRITTVTGSTRENVKRIVRQSIADNMEASVGDQARLIRKQITAEGGKMSQWRARMIARTEVVSASNIGQQVGAEATKQPMKKEWLATMDGSTRDAHANMNGVQVGLENDFIVNGERLRTPGDPSGSAENVINCRCSVGYVVI